MSQSEELWEENLAQLGQELIAASFELDELVGCLPCIEAACEMDPNGPHAKRLEDILGAVKTVRSLAAGILIAYSKTDYVEEQFE